MLYLGILALEFFKKTVVIFETSTWKFAKLSLDLQNIFSFVFYHPVFHQNVTLLQWFYAHLLSLGELSALRLWIILVMLLQHSVVLSLPKQPVNSSKRSTVIFTIFWDLIFYQIFLSPSSETMRDYYLESWYVRVASWLAKAYYPRKLGNIRKVFKLHRMIA